VTEEMKIIHLLSSCIYEKIEEKIKIHYGTKEIDRYKKLYYYLKNMQVNSTSNEILCIYISAYKEDEDEDIKIDDFMEDDTSLYYDVSAYEKNDDKVYSIAATKYSDFLQYEIDEKTLRKFSFETILAHCFWEITCYGFEDNK